VDEINKMSFEDLKNNSLSKPSNANKNQQRQPAVRFGTDKVLKYFACRRHKSNSCAKALHHPNSFTTNLTVLIRMSILMLLE